MKKKVYIYNYCSNKMNEFDYKTYNEYCGKCREILDWKNILSDIKEVK
jgi:hypothetical protein